MTLEDLQSKAKALEAKLADAKDEERVLLHQQLHRVLAAIKAQGGRVPEGLRLLDTQLTDEEVENAFDNMPV